jgi:alpha-D-xyloside xylohydrolase
MIRHLGEQLVPFMDSGFARDPETPLAGQAVTVRCRAENTVEAPVLTLRTQDGEREIAGQSADGRTYAFELGAFNCPQTVSYRFVSQSESTGWYTFDVVSQETVDKPLGCYRDGDCLRVALCADVALALAGGETLTMTLCQQAAQGEPCEGGELLLPDGFSIAVDRGSLWALKRLSELVAECKRYTLLRAADGRVVRVSMEMTLARGPILGTGERFDAVNREGRVSDCRVVEKYTHQGEHSYLPVPFFLTDKGYGWYRQSDIPSQMRFYDTATIAQETQGDALTRDVLWFGAPAKVLQNFVQATGRPALPPEWALGVWISSNGWNTDAEVDAQLEALKRYRYPADVMVLEQWSDERTFYRWHSEHWRDPAAMVRRVRDAGLHMVLWQIPVIKREKNGEVGETLANDERETIANGYAVKRADGTPYRITENWFSDSMLLDFTNPEAVRWWFNRRKPLLDMGVEGFKTDGGEFLYEKAARLYDGTSGLTAHNLYPMRYESAYREFMSDNGVEGVTFSRAGYVGAHTCPIHWAGDQVSEWSELQSQLTAGISAGLSGVLFWSFDIGGFAGQIPGAELYLRSTALGCFCPVMQWHSEPRAGQFSGGKGEGYVNDRSPWNLAEKLGDEKVLTLACDFARLRQTLRPYLWQEAQHCVDAGRPMMAHLCLDFPEDSRAFATQDEFMLGRELLVAPLTRPGEDTRAVYLPVGTWTEFFTGETFRGPCEIRVSCPLSRIPVYQRGERVRGILR